MTNTLQNRWGSSNENITNEEVKAVAESICQLQQLTHLELDLYA